MANFAHSMFILLWSHHLERASTLDFKDAAAPRFGYSDAMIYLFKHIFVFNRSLKVIPFSGLLHTLRLFWKKAKKLPVTKKGFDVC